MEPIFKFVKTIVNDNSWTPVHFVDDFMETSGRASLRAGETIKKVGIIKQNVYVMNKNTTNYQKQIDIIHQNTVVLYKNKHCI